MLQPWASCSHLCASVTKQYNLVLAKGRWCSAAPEVTAGLAESNGTLPPGGWLTTCGLTACTPGSAPGPILGIEYGKAFTFYITYCKTLYIMWNWNVGQCLKWWPPCWISVAPLFNAAVSLTPITRVPSSNAAKMQNPLKLAGVPQTRQQISAVSRPTFAILWGHVEEVLLFNKLFFFRLSIRALVEKIWSDKIVRWCPDGEFLTIFCVPHFQQATCSTLQTCILNSH